MSSSDSAMLARFGKYTAVFTCPPEHVEELEDGTVSYKDAKLYAIWDERKALNGINVASANGSVFHIPDDLLDNDQLQFRRENRDQDGRLGTLTVIANFLSPKGCSDSLFPEPMATALHSEQYAKAIARCSTTKGRPSGGQVATFNIRELDLFSNGC